jgi:outer membrane biosynthesis protein TonB
MHTRALALLILLLPLPCLAANPHLPKGVRLLNKAEDEKALAAFQQALKWKRSTPKEITQAHLYLGITYSNLIRQKDAARHFRTAFQREPDLKLPEDISPKTAEFAEKIRAEVKAVQPTKPEPVTQPIGVKPQPEPQPQPQPEPQPQPPPPPAKKPVNWPAWTLAALAVAAGGTGLALGLVARSAASDANATDAAGLKLSTSEAQSQHDSASKKALAANILFGVAGAAAIASTVMFIVGYGERKPPRATAGVAPVLGGAMIQVSGVTW